MADARLNEIFGQNLRNYRESLGQSRQIFSAAFNGSPYTLQSYELGHQCPNLKRFLNLCNTFQISPNLLLDSLFPWRTEMDEVRDLAALADGLYGQNAQKLVEFQDIYIRDTVETRPWMMGAPLGIRIHVLRMESGMNIDTLAKLCMVSRATMQGYESSQYDPTLPAVLHLCEVFHISPEYLLAPFLQKLSYPDARIADLRPRQIKTLLELSRYMRNNL